MFIAVREKDYHSNIRVSSCAFMRSSCINCVLPKFSFEELKRWCIFGLLLFCLCQYSNDPSPSPCSDPAE